MRGSITVFFSLVFVTIVSLLGTTIESARWASARWYWRQAGSDGIRSVFADYCEPLFREYGVLFLDKTYGEERDIIGERFEEYISYNLEPAKGSIYKRSFLYKGEVTNIEVPDMMLAIDGNGAVFRKAVYDYMKHRIPANLVGDFLEQFDFINQAKVIQDFFDKIKKIEKKLSAIDEAVMEINSLIGDIRQAEEELWELSDELDELLKIEKPDEKIKKQLEDINNEIKSTKQGVVSCAYGILGNCSTYESVTEEVSEYLLNIADGWLDSLNVSQNIKDTIYTEIENLLVYSGGKGDVYGVEGCGDILDGLINALEEWSEDDSTGWFWELDEIGVELNWADGLSGEIVKGFDAEKLLEELKTDGFYALLCPGYSKLSEMAIEPFYNRAYVNYRALSYVPEKLVAETVAEDIVFQEYMDRMFSSYIAEREDTVAKYELEYIIGGRTSDKENINAVIRELLLVREALNLVYIMCDAQKKEEAHSLAMSCLGFTGVYAAVKAMQYLILTVWAFGEAMLDVRIIMSGGTVPVLKAEEDWKLDLDGLLNMGKVLASLVVPAKKDGMGDWDYEAYLKLLLYMGKREEQTLRVMDLIEANLQKNYSLDFRIINLVYQAEVKADFCLEPLFSKNALFRRKTTMNFKYSY